MRNPFAETGAASRFKDRIENHSSGVTDLEGVDHLGHLTPFQNQVLDYAKKKEQEAKEEKQEEMRQNAQGGGRQKNARSADGAGASGPGSKMEQEETVRYVNKELNPDHEVHESD